MRLLRRGRYGAPFKPAFGAFGLSGIRGGQSSGNRTKALSLDGSLGYRSCSFWAVIWDDPRIP
jgi:hypothetical protein